MNVDDDYDDVASLSLSHSVTKTQHVPPACADSVIIDPLPTLPYAHGMRQLMSNWLAQARDGRVCWRQI